MSHLYLHKALKVKLFVLMKMFGIAYGKILNHIFQAFPVLKSDIYLMQSRFNKEIQKIDSLGDL
jgi:hypothetical protein